MKYKTGDRIVLKSWAKMVEEFGTGHHGEIYLPHGRVYTSSMIRFIQRSHSRVATIVSASRGNRKSTGCYELKEAYRYWDDSMIEGLVGETKVEVKDEVEDVNEDVNEIEDRFEILGL